MILVNKNLTILILFILTSLFLSFASKVYPSLYLQIFIFILLGLFTFKLIKGNALVFAPILGFIFIRVTELASGLLIESGGYLTETGVTGVYTGSFIRLPIYYLIFFYSVFSAYNYLNLNHFKSKHSNFKLNRPFIFFTIVFSTLVLLSGLLAGIQNGFSFFLGVNRFTFREFGGSPLLNFFLNNRFLVLVITSAVYSISKKRFEKVFAIIIASFTVLLSVLHGEQFTSMVSLFLAFFIAPLIIATIQGKQVGNKIMVIGLSALLIGALVVLLVYSQQGYDIKDLAERRLLLQAQLWYVVDTETKSLFFGNLDSFFRNIPSFTHLNTSEFKNVLIPYGMRELMYVHALPSIYDQYLENDVTFTMGQMAMLLYWFGYLGMIPAVIFTGILFGGVILYLNNSILRMDIISTLLASKIFMWFVFGFQQGEYWYIWGAKTLVFIIFVYLFERFRNRLGIPLLSRM